MVNSIHQYNNDAFTYLPYLTERLVEREIRQRPDARRPDGKIVQNEGDGGQTEHNDLGTAWTTQLLTLQREPDHQIPLDGEADHVPDRQKTGDVRGVDEELAPAWTVVDLPRNDSHPTITLRSKDTELPTHIVKY